METQDRPATCLEKVAMTFVGTVNNLFFLIVMSSAQRIVEHYNEKGAVPAVDMACTFCGLFAGSVNTLFSALNFTYDFRFFTNASLMAIGLIGCAYAPKFWTCLISILFVGFSCNFGESVTLGYLAYINKSSLMKFWGIGTGTAGILGSLFSILVISFKFDYKYSFLSLLPLVAIYFCSYFFILREKKKGNEQLNSTALLSQQETEPTHPDEKVKVWSWSYLRKIIYYIITCDTVYFAQYVIASAFYDCAHTQEFQKTHKYFFPLLLLVQHVAVLLFASTLTFFEFPHLTYMALFQMFNFCIWLSQAMLHWMTTWSEFLFVFLVGAMGGLSYANTFNMILKDKNLTQKESELGTNITALTETISVLIATGFGQIAEKTFLKPYVPQ
ncbi:CLN3 protein [Trichomonas vaginalis G3]|uniref:CLN3 protein n=1 Tax=Trichomonas vaginalis (strain ATCC PRA-98 / G3) TaxID=412133 RepID=A2EJK1_TRIV3|nr:arginine transport [Trichomonas vaginalis G3]EAY07171.1 CLN3 protein [Trichomonas vaginalis G3]KAI5503646.1 arginine transport [Trichomonas vaginalis G3]|eukprot:XP_001319394.1 CLN3 protein [Trichomonas vaginalis G3]